MQLELPDFDPKNLPEWAQEFTDFVLLTANLTWNWPINVHF